MKTYYITEGTPTKKQDPSDIARETLFKSTPGVGKSILTIYNIGNIIGDLITDKEERQETLEVLQNSVQNVPYKLYNAFANQLPALATDIFKIADADVDYDPEELKYLKTLNPEDPYQSLTGDPTGFKTNADRIKFLENYDSSVIAQRQKKADEFLKKKYKEIDNVNKYLIKDTGEGIVKGIKQGDASDFIGGIVNANVQMIETVVPAMLTGGISLPFQIIAPMYTDYNITKAENLYGKDDPEALNKLIDNDETEVAVPLALGLVASGLEYIGFKGITKLMLGNQASSKFITNLFLTSNKEGITELLQSGVEGVNEAAAQDKSAQEITKAFFDNTFSEKGFEAYLNGFVGSAGVGSGGTIINRALRSDNASVKEISSSIKNIAELTLAKNSTKDNEVKEALEQEIKQKELDLKNYILEKRKVADVLNDDQKASLINLINQKDDVRSKYFSLLDKLRSNQITKKEFGYSARSLSNQNNRLTEQIELINESAKEQLLVTGLEAVKEQGDAVGLKQELFETKEQYAALFGRKGSKRYNEALKSDGHISDDGSTYFVNMQTAREAGAIGVGSHELLHGIIGKSFSKLKPEAQRKLNENFLNLLSERDRKTILNRLEDAYEITGDAVFTTEELYTAFSDEIIDGGVKFDEGVFGKVKNVFEEILRQLSSAGYFSEDGTTKFLYRKEFGNARQAYNFVKDYSLTIKKTGKVTQRAKEFAKEDPGSQGEKMSRTSLIEDINKMQKGAVTKAEFQKSEIFNEVFKAIQPGGAINNYIRSLGMSAEKTQETIDSVTDRLINFDPAAKRKDGSVIGPKGLGEFIMANVGFAKLDAAKTLAKKAAETKRTTKLDDPDVKDIADTPTPTEETQAQDVKLRKLKDFNVNLDDGLADALTVAEVDDVLDNFNNGKITFEQAQKEIDKLALKDIRASLSKIIPKISKGKPTPEYEAFIRKEYDEIIQSLGIKTIRTSYKKFFTQEKTGVQDYKNIDPVTGKVSNYRKSTQVNTTNKREFIKYFLEAKGGVLNERRTALIRRIAKRKASLAVDNYIEQNSNNIEAIVKAKIRTLSDTAENATNEQVSFDSVKFSKTFNKNVKRITNNRNSKGLYIAPDGTEVKLIDLGRVFEQAFSETLQEVAKNIKGFIVDSLVSTEAGGVADAIISYLGVKENHEIKKGLTAFMGSTLFNTFDVKSGAFTLANEVHNSIKGLKGFVKKVAKNLDAKTKVINKEIDLYNQKYGYKKGDAEFAEQITGNIVKGKPEFVPVEVLNNLQSKELGVLKAGIEIIQNHYGTKKAGAVKSISLFGFGSFRLDESSIFKGLPMLDVNTEVYASIRTTGSQMRGKQKFRNIKIGLQFRLDGKPKNTPNSGIITEQSILEALGNPAAFSKNIDNTTKLSKSINSSRLIKENKGITVLDFDDTLATTESLVKYTAPDGTTGTLNAEEFANTYQSLLEQDYVFDFSEFNKVVKGKIAPLFQKALKLQKKFGPENMFVLTARPPQAQQAIFDFLKANGLNIPLKNITGLANSTSEAKALWIADKVSEGYNDFYFADDALQNVQAVDNMLEQFDVKRKVQQARVKFSKTMNDEFNDILEDVTGIESVKRFDFIKARKRGASKGKFRFFVPPSHEDFVGLLYNFMGKGRKGDAHRDFFEKSLVRPLNRANREYDTARQSIATDYKNLNKQFPDVKKMLIKKTPDGDFVYQDAVRVYLWDKHGYDIPGLSDIDQKNLVELVKSDSKLKAYADAINTISRQETYVDPTEGWDSGDIRMDLDDATGRVGRAQFFEEFNENASIIFSTENLNKIEAGYGKGMKEALEDMLYRIKTGRNRPSGQNKLVNGLMNYLNGSVGSVMFFNMRSALLQQMSLVNYINFADNNIFAAAKAFANQKQYWEDWSFIFNSDMLKQRRGGIQTDVNGAELAAEMRKSKNPHRFLISKLLQLGFLPTQIGDNIAIATGGATYYRNRINTYLKEGLSEKEAEAKAFTDFQDITQSTQQSARPDMVSQQQASILGKIILNFQNVTSQFNRLGKKAFLDIKNRRITKPNKTQMQSDISNAARITYYFAVQNVIFYSLQTALFMMLFGDDEEDNNKLFLKKQDRLINGSIDSILRGSGVAGAVISTLKNVAIAFARQRDVNYNPDESAVVVEALNFSPVVGIKARKIVNAEKTLNYNKKIIKEMEDFDIDNPQWSAVTNYVEGFTNAPLNRLYNKTQNVRQALSNEHEAWERVLMFLGWSQYNLNLENTKIENIKKDIKAKNKKPRRKKIKTLTGF